MTDLVPRGQFPRAKAEPSTELDEKSTANRSTKALRRCCALELRRDKYLIAVVSKYELKYKHERRVQGGAKPR